MTEDDFLKSVCVVKQLCHYVASRSPNMLRWQVTRGYFNEIVRKYTSQVAAHPNSIMKIKPIDTFLSSGDALIGASLSRNTYKAPIVAHAQITDVNFEACLCLLCKSILKTELRFMSKAFEGPDKVSSLYFFCCGRYTYGNYLLLFVVLCWSSRSHTCFSVWKKLILLSLPSASLTAKLKKTGPTDNYFVASKTLQVRTWQTRLTEGLAPPKSRPDPTDIEPHTRRAAARGRLMYFIPRSSERASRGRAGGV